MLCDRLVPRQRQGASLCYCRCLFSANLLNLRKRRFYLNIKTISKVLTVVYSVTLNVFLLLGLKIFRSVFADSIDDDFRVFKLN